MKGQLTDWRSFLRKGEKHCPGITAAAGNLPVALCYGLGAFHNHTGEEHGEELVAYARWLVIGMMNRISTVAYQIRHSGIERLASKLAQKLSADGPMIQRDLIRKCSKLKVAACSEALSWLSDHHIVAEMDKQWGIVGDAASI